LQDGGVSPKEVKLAVPQSKKNHLSFPTGIVYRMNLIHKSHNARAVVRAWSQPGYHGVFSSIYFFHYINLVVSLKNITLINAECIDPDERNDQVTTPGRSSGPLRLLLATVMYPA
jgi:hypothetical protein